jgi:uncharacterized protein
MKATLCLTQRCNLACDYCYAHPSNGGSAHDMALDVAQRAVAWIFNQLPADEPDGAPGGTPLDLCFFGGEPLLCLETLARAARLARVLAQMRHVPLQMSLTTNGTLLSAEALQRLGELEIEPCVSLDGPPAVHDAHRRHLHGRGSHTETLAGLLAAREALPRVQVNAVYGPDTLEALPETVAYLDGLDVAGLHINPNITAAWPEATWPRFGPVYDRIADYAIARYQAGAPLALNLLDSKLILLLKGGYGPADVCSMGEREWAIAPNGAIYPCERFVGAGDGAADHSLALGHLDTGVDETRRCALLARRGNHTPACAACPDRPYCMNWCGCTNYHLTGQTDQAAPVLCASERAAIRAAEKVLISLGQAGNEAFVDHLQVMMQSGGHVR